MLNRAYKVASLLASSVIILGCGGGGGNSTPVNQTPSANAGQQVNGFVGVIVTLDGRLSADPEGKPLSYTWNQVSGPVGSIATLKASNTVVPTFTADKEGTYTFSLITNDGASSSSPAQVTFIAKKQLFSALPVAAHPVEQGIPDWIVTTSTSSLTGVKSALLNASSLGGEFKIVCPGDGKNYYYFKPDSVTGNGSIQIRIGNNPVISQIWTESSSNGFRVLFSPTFDYNFLLKIYQNWDLVVSYNAFSSGARTVEVGGDGLSYAMDKTRDICKWPEDLFPIGNGWGKPLPTVPPDDAIEATDVSGLDVTKTFRLIAWRAINAYGKQQLLVRMGDPANSAYNFYLSGRRFYVSQNGKTVSAVAGIAFQSSSTDPTIIALNGDFDVSKPFVLNAYDFHFNTLELPRLFSTVQFN